MTNQLIHAGRPNSTGPFIVVSAHLALANAQLRSPPHSRFTIQPALARPLEPQTHVSACL